MQTFTFYNRDVGTPEGCSLTVGGVTMTACYYVTMMLCLVSADQHGELRPGPCHLRQVGHHRCGGRGADKRIQADIDIDITI